MFNILIIDDNPDKIYELQETIKQIGDNVQVDYELEVKKACCVLEKRYYDLLILDVQLPSIDHRGGVAEKGGIQILEMISEMDSINKPAQIIGLTAFDENYEEVKREFENKLWHLVKYSKSSIEWKNQILEKIEYLLLSRECFERSIPKKIEDICIDCVIITAVDNEFNTVIKCGFTWKQYQREGDPTRYYYTTFEKNGNTLKLLLVKQNQMGMSASSMLTTKIIEAFSPKLVCMVGIAGGRKEEVNLGDIIIASESWDYGSGKIRPKSASSGFELSPEPHQIGISAACKEYLSDDFSKQLYQVRMKWNESNGKEINHDIKIHIGALASGASVVQDDKMIAEYILPQNRKVLGLDMETYGVYYAAKNAYNKKVEFLSIKAVSDFADSSKNDDYQLYSAFVSTHFLLENLHDILERIQ